MAENLSTEHLGMGPAGQLNMFTPEQLRPARPEVTATPHRIEERIVDGRYLARLGTVLLSDNGEPQATMSFTAYENAPDATKIKNRRPVTIVFSGGPIGPSTLSLDPFLGPDRIPHVENFAHPRFGDLPDNPQFAPNPHTPLPDTDLVFVDPVGTGFGDTLPGVDPHTYYGTARDVDAAAAFVEWYMDDIAESDAPFVLAGASYAAGFRVLELALRLQKRGLPVSGIVSIVGHYDYALEAKRKGAKEHQEVGEPLDPRIYAADLPVLAVTALHHNRVEHGPPYKLFREVEEFAVGEYMDALRNFDRLTPRKIQYLGETLMRYTGMPDGVIFNEEAPLRIDRTTFRTTLLEGLEVSMVDGRVALPQSDTRLDVALDKWEETYKRLVTERLLSLGFPAEGEYNGIIQAYPDWSFDDELYEGRNALRVAAELSDSQPRLPILHVQGMYDLIQSPVRTRFFWNEVNSIARVGKPVETNSREDQLRPGISLLTVPAGHELGGSLAATHDVGMAVGRIAGQAAAADYRHGPDEVIVPTGEVNREVLGLQSARRLQEKIWKEKDPTNVERVAKILVHTRGRLEEDAHAEIDGRFLSDLINAMEQAEYPVVGFRSAHIVDLRGGSPVSPSGTRRIEALKLAFEILEAEYGEVPKAQRNEHYAKGFDSVERVTQTRSGIAIRQRWMFRDNEKYNVEFYRPDQSEADRIQEE